MLQKRIMEHYEPEPLIEQFSDPFPFDIENDPSYFQIKIEGKGTRVKTLVNRSLKNFGSGKKIVFIAQGRDTTKAVSCVEIMKTNYKKPIYQLTRINQIRTIETWYPRIPRAEGLDPIRVTRAVPTIYILISQEKLPEDEEGYQVYNHRDPKKVLNQQAVEASDNDAKQDATENSSSNSDPGCDQKENSPSAENESTDDNNYTPSSNTLNNES